jgi:hypothetical protein
LLAGFVTASIGAVGLASGAAFLKLAPWSRTTLEVLSWIVLALTAVPPVFVLRTLTPNDAGYWEMTGFAVQSALTCGVGLVFMIRSLRSLKVRAAMQALPNNGIERTPSALD